jgi:hypothetical protein
MIKITQQQINYIVVTICALIAFIFALKVLSWVCFVSIACLISDDIFRFSAQIKMKFSRFYCFIQLAKIMWPGISLSKIWRATQKEL